MWIILANIRTLQHIITLSKHGSITGNQYHNHDNRKGKDRVNFLLTEFFIVKKGYDKDGFSILYDLNSMV